MTRTVLGLGLVAVPAFVLVAGLGFVTAADCQIDCWDRGIGLWFMAAIGTGPFGVIGGILLKRWRAAAMWTALALMPVLYIGVGAVYFLGFLDH